MSKFLIIQQRADTNLPPETFRRLLPSQITYMRGLRQSGRVEMNYGFAALNGGVFVLDVASHDELQQILYGQPLWSYLKTETYPLNAIEAVEQSITDILEKNAVPA